MRLIQSRLYSVAAPLWLLPVMGFQFDQIGDFLRGDEFRTVVAELVTQVFAGIAEAFILVITELLFGVQMT